MTTVAEENIIKKRLLIEGDSGNEDKLINKLTKSFIKWASNAQNEGADVNENTEALYEQMQINLSHAEFGLLRNHLIYDMNQMEQNNYKVYSVINKLKISVKIANIKIILLYRFCMRLLIMTSIRQKRRSSKRKLSWRRLERSERIDKSMICWLDKFRSIRTACKCRKPLETWKRR